MVWGDGRSELGLEGRRQDGGWMRGGERLESRINKHWVKRGETAGRVELLT